MIPLSFRSRSNHTQAWLGQKVVGRYWRRKSTGLELSGDRWIWYCELPMARSNSGSAGSAERAEAELRVCIERWVAEAGIDSAGLPDSIQEALNSGDGVYRP